MASPHTITHDHTISVWFYDSGPRHGYVYECARRREKTGRGGGGLDKGRATDMCERKKARLCTDRRVDTNTVARTQESWAACEHTQTQDRQPPPPSASARHLSVAFSLLALSCFPDSRWRPDRRAEWLEVRLCDDRPGAFISDQHTASLLFED